MPSAEARSHPAIRRHTTALFTLSLDGVGVRSSLLRFPQRFHGDGDDDFVATLVDIARQRGFAGYVADRSNRWLAVHRTDAARLARLAVEAAPSGSALHAVGHEGVPFREIAEAIGRHLGIPSTSVSPVDAYRHFGYLGAVVAWIAAPRPPSRSNCSGGSRPDLACSRTSSRTTTTAECGRGRVTLVHICRRGASPRRNRGVVVGPSNEGPTTRTTSSP